MKKLLPILLVVVLSGTLGVLVSERFTSEPGNAVSGLPPGGGFTLTTRDGPLTLDSLRGQVVLLYFGYAGCPDVCPTSLAVMGSALKKFTPAELERVRALFVSVDPERDTPERLAAYAAFFHPGMTGATTDVEAINELTRRYGAAYLKVPSGGDDYAVDHTSSTYLIGPDGRLRAILPHGTPAEVVVTAVREHLPG